MLHVVIVNSPPFKEKSLTRKPLMFFSLSSLSISTKIFGYSSFMYAGNLSWSICFSRLTALFRWLLTMVSSNIAWLSLKSRYANEAGIYGRMNEFVLITKWILSPSTFGRNISLRKSSLEVRICIISSKLKDIFAMAFPCRIPCRGPGSRVRDARDTRWE